MSGSDYPSDSVDEGQLNSNTTAASLSSSASAAAPSSSASSSQSSSASLASPGSPTLSKRRRFEDEVDCTRRERPERSDNEHESTRNEEARRGMNSTNSNAADTPGDDKLELRLLIDGPLVGAIIGRQGASIKKLREDYGAFINILQDNSAGANPNVKERVMVVRGPMPALHSTLSNLLDVIHESLRVRESRGVGAEAAVNDPALNTKLVLLVHRGTVGAIIGKAGDTIKSTAAETGARVQVSPETLMNSTEKSVALIGNKSQVLAALERVMSQIKNAHVKAGQTVIPYQPQQAQMQMMPPVGMGMQRSPYDQQAQQQFYPGQQQPRFDDRRQLGYGGGNYPQQGMAPAPFAPVGGQQGPVSEQKIAIPSICAGCVIGRGGEVIKSLRMQSGCAIQVENQDQSNPTERVVVINGTQQAIQTAVRLIRQCVENFKPPH